VKSGLSSTPRIRSGSRSPGQLVRTDNVLCRGPVPRVRSGYHFAGEALPVVGAAVNTFR